MDWLINSDYAAAPVNIPMMLLGLLLAFLCGHVMAWVYMLTHSGLSYSRAFVSALPLLSVIVALVMMVLSNNLVTAFGLMAVFAIVRFRNILRDTLDTAYVLAAIVIGMACGTQKFTSAVLGCLLIAGILLYFWFTAFGSRHRYDLILNLQWTRPLGDLAELRQLLQRHSLKAQCTSQRPQETGPGANLSYRLLLRDASRVEELLTELKTLDGVARVASLNAEDESEL